MRRGIDTVHRQGGAGERLTVIDVAARLAQILIADVGRLAFVVDQS